MITIIIIDNIIFEFFFMLVRKLFIQLLEVNNYLFATTQLPSMLRKSSFLFSIPIFLICKIG